MSDGVGDNYDRYRRHHRSVSVATWNHSKKIKGERVTVLHQWDQPDVLFTKDDEEYLTAPLRP